MSRVAVFFDLDRTLLDVNSARLFIRAERAAGRLSGGQVLRSALYFGLYHLALVDVERAIQRAAAHFAGQAAADLALRTEAWFDAELAGRLRPGAAAALEAHRSAGDRLVVLTGSSQFAAEAAAATWNLDDAIGNVFEVDAAGRLTGRFETPVSCGAGKTVRAERWAAAAGLDLEEATFYTDSFTDRSLLERVGSPRIVAPDPRLARLARRRGWPILDW